MRLRALVVVASLSGVAACDEPARSPSALERGLTSPAATTAEARVAHDLARAACDAVAGCCASRRLGAFDLGVCTQVAAESLETVARLRRAAGGVATDPAKSAACAAKISKYASSCVDPEAALGMLDTSPCDEIFAGGKLGGARCDVSAECARRPGVARAFCNHDTHLCEDLGVARAGEACVGDCDAEGCTDAKYAGTPLAYCDARDGLGCDPATKRCAPRPRVASACDKERPCELAAFCRDGTCAPRGGVGSSCASNADACSDQAKCDAGSKMCVARAADGRSCSEDDDCASHNCAGRVCRARADATMLRVTADLRLFCPAD